MKQPAKKITLAIVVLGFLTGVVGSFVPSFNMAGFTMFVKGFSALYIPLIASIGINSGIEKHKEEKK